MWCEWRVHERRYRQSSCTHAASASFVKTAVHWSQLNAFSDLAVTEAKVGVITGTVVDVVGMERGGMIGGAGGGGSGSVAGGDVALPRVSW